MATIVVRKIDVLPTALTLAVVATVLSFIQAFLIALGVGGLMAGMLGMPFFESMTGNVMVVILIPIMTFITTFIAVAIAAIVYNLVAEKIGGIKFETL